MTKLISLMLAAGEDSDAQAAMVSGEQRLGPGEVRRSVGRAIAALESGGVTAGQRLVAIPTHDPNAVFLLAAASAIGAQIVMPYNLRQGALTEWAKIVSWARPHHVVDLRGDRVLLEGLRALGVNVLELRARALADASPLKSDIIVRSPEPVADFLVFFTSGTTGRPKAISIPESLICRRIVRVSERLKFDGAARIFMSGLMNNTTGIIFSFGALLHQATLVFPGGRDVESWPTQVQASAATHLMLRPASMKRFIHGARQTSSDLSSLRVVAYGAAALPRQVLEEGRALMPCEWVQGYGLSETFGPFCWLTEEDHRAGRYQEHVYCVGRPDDTMEVMIDRTGGGTGDVGEIVLRGAASMMRGYYDDSLSTVIPPGECFRTGDLGRLTSDGYLVLKGRRSHTLLSADGHQIYPEEVESVLAGIPGVDDAVLLSLPGANDLGSSPVACIQGEIATRGDAEIRELVTEALAAHLGREKWPDYVFASRLPFPTNGNDKIIKEEVAKLLPQGALIAIAPGTGQ